jgi:hypothetical protein
MILFLKVPPLDLQFTGILAADFGKVEGRFLRLTYGTPLGSNQADIVGPESSPPSISGHRALPVYNICSLEYLFIYLFAVLGLERGAYTLSHSTHPLL